MTKRRIEPCAFAGNPLDRASEKRGSPDWIAARLADPSSVVLPLWRGDPLIREKAPAWLAASAFDTAANSGKTVFLGLGGANGAGPAHFAIDVSDALSAADAPYADLGDYMSLREAAGDMPMAELAIVGQARWLLDWHRRHARCAVCGAPTDAADGGAKRVCGACGAEHFPRTDPVAIVLAVHDGACLLGRSPHFPPTFFSALAGYVEAAETPEECAARELKEEAGVVLEDVRYQFSQPWPFPSTLMMGFIADAAARDLTLDEKEVVEARWVDRADIRRLIAGERREDLRLPPRFTIARQLIEVWARDGEA